MIRHPKGNELSLSIELTLRRLSTMSGAPIAEDEDFVPGGPVAVTLTNGAKHLPVEVTLDGNVVSITDHGTLPVGVYGVEIQTVDAGGRRYRYRERDVLEIVDFSDDAGIAQPIEFQVEARRMNAVITSAGSQQSPGDEVDPVFAASPAAGITQDDIDRWNAGQSGGGMYEVSVVNGKLIFGSGSQQLPVVINGKLIL